ncbi:MAG TPA: hypothetical protein VF573_21795 [Paraburkholderia sp.]|uniref:hypothetical protein n=1 Tax=Paraburkholderia sp. TaxID=1926495 RepID=UPI002ED361B2
MADPKQTDTQPDKTADDIAHPHPAVHSDNEKSKLPQRDDAHRNESPADRPGRKPGEGEPSVG